jgi:hypothetical protein
MLMSPNKEQIKKFIDASYKEKREVSNIDGYVLDNSLSKRRDKIYYNPETNNAKHVIAGTDNMMDSVNNLLIPFDLHHLTNRYKSSEDIHKKANAKYGKENVDLITHSQSGNIAENFAKQGLVGGSNITLNPAIIGKHHKDLIVIKSSFDPVSAFTQTTPEDTIINSQTLNPLTEHKTGVLGKGLSEKELIKMMKKIHDEINNHHTKYGVNKNLLKEYTAIGKGVVTHVIKPVPRDMSELIKSEILMKPKKGGSTTKYNTYTTKNPPLTFYEAGKQYMIDSAKKLAASAVETAKREAIEYAKREAGKQIKGYFRGSDNDNSNNTENYYESPQSKYERELQKYYDDFYDFYGYEYDQSNNINNNYSQSRGRGVVVTSTREERDIKRKEREDAAQKIKDEEAQKIKDAEAAAQKIIDDSRKEQLDIIDRFKFEMVDVTPFLTKAFNVGAGGASMDDMKNQYTDLIKYVKNLVERYKNPNPPPLYQSEYRFNDPFMKQYGGNQLPQQKMFDELTKFRKLENADLQEQKLEQEEAKYDIESEVVGGAIKLSNPFTWIKNNVIDKIPAIINTATGGQYDDIMDLVNAPNPEAFGKKLLVVAIKMGVPALASLSGPGSAMAANILANEFIENSGIDGEGVGKRNIKLTELDKSILENLKQDIIENKENSNDVVGTGRSNVSSKEIDKAYKESLNRGQFGKHIGSKGVGQFGKVVGGPRADGTVPMYNGVPNVSSTKSRIKNPKTPYNPNNTTYVRKEHGGGVGRGKNKPSYQQYDIEEIKKEGQEFKDALGFSKNEEIRKKNREQGIARAIADKAGEGVHYNMYETHIKNEEIKKKFRDQATAELNRRKEEKAGGELVKGVNGGVDMYNGVPNVSRPPTDYIKAAKEKMKRMSDIQKYGSKGPPKAGGELVKGVKPVRKGRFVKGSQEAKDHMAMIRAKKG